MNGGPVDLEDVRRAVSAVGETGLETVIVGANALVVQGLPAATYDLDFAIRKRDFESARIRLEHLGWRTEAIGNSLSATREGIEVEIVHPGPFGPPEDPDAFFEYLRAEGSAPTELGRAARIEAVWYMRLGFEPETGRQKIEQDIALRLVEDPNEVLWRIEELARRMRRLEEIAPHVERLRAAIRRRASSASG